ncbi:MAG: MBL fold metallo-hydrolase [Candidatus Kariarchaeaceae archaeon]
MIIKKTNQTVWEHHVVSPIMTNCYILGNKQEAIMLDPGGPEVLAIAEKLRNQGIQISHILATHGHFDHLSYCTEVKNMFDDAKVYLHKGERETYTDFINVMPMYGLQKTEVLEPDVWVNDNQVLNISDLSIKVIHTPGHSPGSAVFYLKGDETSMFPTNTAFVGDCIFEGSIGRVDLPHSDPNQMFSSLQRLMDEFTADTYLYSGHGNATSMKKETATNPYLLAIQKGIKII